MIRSQGGSAVGLMLILLSGLAALALTAAAAAMAALALAGHQYDAQLALEAADAGIILALARAADERGPGIGAERDWPGDDGPQAVMSTRTVTDASVGALPEGFSLGESADTFSARHYFIVSDAKAGRAAKVRLEQGFYLVVPAP